MTAYTALMHMHQAVKIAEKFVSSYFNDFYDDYTDVNQFGSVHDRAGPGRASGRPVPCRPLLGSTTLLSLQIGLSACNILMIDEAPSSVLRFH